MTQTPRVSIVIPAFEEDENIASVLHRILEGVTLSCEVLVVVDDDQDPTVKVLDASFNDDDRVSWVVNTYGRGPANAIRYGIDRVRAPVTVVTMADGSDDPQQIDELARLVERGVAVAAASRYAKSGQQIGGQGLKRALSRLAGHSLYWLGRVGTHDATNSFKAYNTAFARAARVESDKGFEIGLELVAKARRARLPVAEVPTIWLDRAFGVSTFQLRTWLPRYVRWYLHAFGAPRPIEGFVPGPLPMDQEYS